MTNWSWQANIYKTIVNYKTICSIVKRSSIPGQVWGRVFYCTLQPALIPSLLLQQCFDTPSIQRAGKSVANAFKSCQPPISIEALCCKLRQSRLSGACGLMNVNYSRLNFSKVQAGCRNLFWGSNSGKINRVLNVITLIDKCLNHSIAASFVYTLL